MPRRDEIREQRITRSTGRTVAEIMKEVESAGIDGQEKQAIKRTVKNTVYQLRRLLEAPLRAIDAYGYGVSGHAYVKLQAVIIDMLQAHANEILEANRHVRREVEDARKHRQDQSGD